MAISGTQTEIRPWHHKLNFTGHPYTSLVVKPLCSAFLKSLCFLFKPTLPQPVLKEIIQKVSFATFISVHYHLSLRYWNTEAAPGLTGERQKFREKNKNIFQFCTHQVVWGIWASILKFDMHQTIFTSTTWQPTSYWVQFTQGYSYIIKYINIAMSLIISLVSSIETHRVRKYWF